MRNFFTSLTPSDFRSQDLTVPATHERAVRSQDFNETSNKPPDDGRRLSGVHPSTAILVFLK